MLIRFLDYSGAPTMFMWVAEAMHKRGHDVTVCTYNTLQKDIKLSEGIRWIDFTDERKGFYGVVSRVRGLIKEMNPPDFITFCAIK